MERKYSANLTGARFLFYEMKKVIKLLSKGMHDKEVRELVFGENLFQYKLKSAIARAFPSVLRRAKSLPEELRDLVLNDSIQNAKLINLVSIMNDDFLFETFMYEVVGTKYKENDLLLGKKEVNLFFTQKSEQNKKVASYTAATLNKLRQVYLRILVEAGLLSSKKDGELIKICMDEELKTMLLANGYKKFVNMFEENIYVKY